MLQQADVEKLTSKVYQMLDTVGLAVESDELTEAMLKGGCTSGPDGRVRVPRGVIDEMVAFQKTRQEADARDQELYWYFGVDWAHSIVWNGQQEEMRERLKTEFLMSAFDCGPTTFYDYPAAQIRPVDSAVFDTMKKFAEATPEIGYISTWYRQDVPAQIERLDSLNRGMRLTRKLAGIEPMYPEVVKYLVEASQIITDRPGDSSFLAGSECLTPPLILENVACEDILARCKEGVHRYHVASMPTVGVNTPVTVPGAVVLGAAEILGGMAACWCLDPEADLSGRMICLLTDMRTANSTPTGPQAAILNLGVKELFDREWGGQCWVEVFFSTVARRPGLQAVFENFFGQHNYSKWSRNPDIPYPGMGTLHSGALGSPTQLMLDMEIRRGQWYAKQPEVTEETLAFEELCERAASRSHFLSSDHTLAHFRELWHSDLFLADDPLAGGDWDGTEKAILDRCEEKWRANLAKWEPPEWSEDKLRAMDALVARAKKEFEID